MAFSVLAFTYFIENNTIQLPEKYRRKKLTFRVKALCLEVECNEYNIKINI